MNIIKCSHFYLKVQRLIVNSLLIFSLVATLLWMWMSYNAKCCVIAMIIINIKHEVVIVTLLYPFQ